MYDDPLAYYMTFTAHGTWLHGDPRKSIIRKHGIPHILPAHAGLYRHEQGRLKSPPFVMDSRRRTIVRDVMVKHCNIRKWRLFALHVRSNHAHVVVRANRHIDRVAEELKGWATRMLRRDGPADLNVWARGSSKKFIFKECKLREKIHYVTYEQGEMMAYYIDEAFRREPCE